VWTSSNNALSHGFGWHDLKEQHQRRASMNGKPATTPQSLGATTAEEEGLSWSSSVASGVRDVICNAPIQGDIKKEFILRGLKSEEL